MGIVVRVGHKAELELKKNELLVGGINNLSKIIAAARCRSNKHPARQFIPEKGHLGSFGRRSCMFLPVRFWITPAPNGSNALSLHTYIHRWRITKTAVGVRWRAPFVK